MAGLIRGMLIFTLFVATPAATTNTTTTNTTTTIQPASSNTTTIQPASSNTTTIQPASSNTTTIQPASSNTTTIQPASSTHTSTPGQPTQTPAPSSKTASTEQPSSTTTSTGQTGSTAAPKTTPGQKNCYNMTCISASDTCLKDAISNKSVDSVNVCPLTGFCKIQRTLKDKQYRITTSCVSKTCDYQSWKSDEGQNTMSCCKTALCNTEDALKGVGPAVRGAPYAFVVAIIAACLLL